jgi:hypothetical protein
MPPRPSNLSDNGDQAKLVVLKKQEDVSKRVDKRERTSLDTTLNSNTSGTRSP